MIILKMFQKIRQLRAQGMVEFALVLPILLLVLYGTMETGRLLFIYGSTVTASRQAARYGSATGEGPNGVYYNDCEGIRDAARNVGFINTFDTIDISYDRGVDASGAVQAINGTFPTCPVAADTLGNGDRIVVRVTTQWTPIVPLVPFDPIVLSSQSERTILVSVDINVAADEAIYNGDTASCMKLNSISAPNFSALGPLSFTYGIKNIGTADGTPTIVDSFSGYKDVNTACSAITADTTGTCTGSYTITQADLDAGAITTKAYSNPLCAKLSLLSNTKTFTASAVQNPAISLTKTPSVEATSIVGSVVTYTYTITNTGNVTLTGPFSVTDNKIASVDCSAAAGTLAPGASTNCTASYTLKASDIQNREIVNNATASNTFTKKPSNTAVTISASASAIVYTPPVYLVVSPSALTATAAGQVITFTYKLKNITDAPITSPSVSDNKATVNCSGASATIAVGGITQCTGTYTVTQADMNSGIAIENTATASGILNGLAVSSNTVTRSTPIAQSPALSVVISGSPSSTPISAGSTITYSYALTNSGNVTLKAPIAATDTLGNTITCADQSDFLVGTTRACTTPAYTVQASDMAAGSIINTVTATAVFNSATVTSATDVDTQTTFPGARFNVAVTADKSLVTAASEQITYTYTFHNTGGVTLTSPYAVTSSLGTASPSSALDCSLASATIDPGNTTTCKSTYTVNTPGTITNTVSAASVYYSGSPVAASNTPQSATTTAYICTASNLQFTTKTSNNVGGDSVVAWTVSNTVGTALPISSISISWDNSGSGSSLFHLNNVVVSNSGVTQNSFPDNVSPYISGTGTLNTGNSTITMTFSKNNVTGVNVTITFASPYGTCHLP
jgi:uncharacterized repeat protein (TIGR01451 family)